MKPRIKKNAWDNWYGYFGNRIAIGFGNSTTETAEQTANRWFEMVSGWIGHPGLCPYFHKGLSAAVRKSQGNVWYVILEREAAHKSWMSGAKSFREAHEDAFAWVSGTKQLPVRALEG